MLVMPSPMFPAGSRPVALVTGANHGIGAATAIALARAGARVLAAYLTLTDEPDPATPDHLASLELTPYEPTDLDVSAAAMISPSSFVTMNSKARGMNLVLLSTTWATDQFPFDVLTVYSTPSQSTSMMS